MSIYKEIDYKDWKTGEAGKSKVSPEHHEELSKYEWFYDDNGVFRLDGFDKIYQHNDVVRICFESGYTIDANGQLVAPELVEFEKGHFIKIRWPHDFPIQDRKNAKKWIKKKVKGLLLTGEMIKEDCIKLDCPIVDFSPEPFEEGEMT
jgi:hypothetical protein